MTERVVAILEARMGSSRLPGKSLLPLAGVPLVLRVVERARLATCLDDVWVATSTSPKDDGLAASVEASGTRVFRGSEDDVLARILGAAHASKATVHVQCWGDCPFLEPSEIDRVVGALRSSDADLAANDLGKPRDLPYGLDVIAFYVAALEKAELATRNDPYHREHGTTFLYQNPTQFRIESLRAPPSLAYPELNLTINTEDDYRFVAAVYERLVAEKPRFTAHDVVALLRSEPSFSSHPNAKALAEPPRV